MNIALIRRVAVALLTVSLAACGGAETAPSKLAADGQPAEQGGDQPAPPPAPDGTQPPAPDGAPAPDQPGAQPGQPGAQPGQPGAQPGQPGAQPGQPGQPGAQPGQPDAGQPGAPAGAPEGATATATASTYRRVQSSPASTAIEEGLTYLKDNNAFDARQRFQAATQADPNSATAWYNLGLVQFRDGKTADAVASLNKAISVNPTYSRATALLVVVHLRGGDIDAAEQAVKAARANRKTDVMLLVASAQVSIARKHFRDAAESCIKALKVDYDNPEVLRTLAEAYLGLKRVGLARLALNKAYGIYTKPPEEEAGPKAEGQVAKKQYDMRLQRGSDGLRGVAAEAIGKEGGLAHIYYLFGRMALEKKRYEEARRHFQKSVEYRSDYAEAWNNLGVTWLVAKKGEEAIDAFTKALVIEPMFLEARINLGNAYRISKRADRVVQAKKQYEKAQQQAPNHPAPWFNLGVVFLENKELANIAEGATDAEKAKAQIARYRQALKLFAEYRTRAGRVAKDDPVNDYVQECKNLIKVQEDTRKAAIENAKEQEIERQRLEEEKKKKEAEEAAKRAAEEAKRAQEAAAAPPGGATPTDAPAAPPADGGTPAAPPADGGAAAPAPPVDSAPAPPPPPNGGGTPPAPDGGTPPAPPAPDGGTPPAPPAPDGGTPPAPPAPDGGTPPAPPAPGDATPPAPPAPDDAAPPAPPAPGGDTAPPRPGGDKADEKKPDESTPPAPPAPDNTAPPPPPPGGDDAPPPPPPPGRG